MKLGLEDGGTSVHATLVVTVTSVAVYWGLLVALGELGVFATIPPVGLGVFVLAVGVGTALGRFASFTGIHRVGASVNSAGISARPLFATALAFLLIGEVVAPQVVGGILLLVVGLVVLRHAQPHPPDGGGVARGRPGQATG